MKRRKLLLFGLVAFAAPCFVSQVAPPITTPAQPPSGFGTIHGTVVREGTSSPTDGRRQNTALYRTTRSNADGRFALSNVPPGPYTVFAWESVSGGAFQNAEFLSRYTGRGVAINVTAGNRASANVTLIPNESAAR